MKKKMFSNRNLLNQGFRKIYISNNQLKSMGEKMKKKPNWLNIILVLLFLSIPLQTITSMQNKSIHGDEIYHVSSGYSKLKTWDYRLLPEHGPLIPVISTFPLLFFDVNFPFDHESWKIKDMNTLMPLFMFEYNENPYDIMFWSRLPMTFLSMILAFYVFTWAKDLYGKKSGVFALFIYVFNIDMLAHSRISSSDFGLTVFVFIAVYHFWKYIKKPTKKRLIIAGITLGLSQLTKFSAIFMFPIYGILFLIILFFELDLYSYFCLWIRKKRRSIPKKNIKKALTLLLSIILIFLVTYITILFAYRFEGVFKPISQSLKEDVHLNKTLFPIEQMIESNNYVKFFANVPSPFPYYYARGLGFSFYFADKPSSSMIINGVAETPMHFFIFAFLTKTQGALLAMVILSILIYKKRNKGIIDESFLIVPFLLFHIAFIFTKKQYGYRYIIQTIPFMIVFVSRLVSVEIKWKKLFYAIISILSIWYIATSLLTFPHYLSYTNELIKTNEVHNYFVDSTVDWGQNLFYIKDYISDNNLEDVKLAYYGFPVVVNYPLPEYYNLPHQVLECSPTSGIIIISPTYFMKNKDCYGWLSDYTPYDMIANSVLVYNITT